MLLRPVAVDQACKNLTAKMRIKEKSVAFCGDRHLIGFLFIFDRL
jgi:hypothetical protein